jgi:hypothetical protein
MQLKYAIMNGKSHQPTSTTQVRVNTAQPDQANPHQSARLPHERDEAVDSTQEHPPEVLQQAQRDLQAGRGAHVGIH